MWPTVELLALDPGWDEVHRDEISALFIRAGHPQTGALMSIRPPDLPATGAGICVP
jgi:hypothetical protein